MKNLIAIIALVCLSMGARAANDNTKDTLYIKTSMVCEMCEARLEKALMFEKGIHNLSFDLKQNTIMVVYKPKKISAKEIEKKVSATGYKANGLAPDKEAYDNLHGCCKAPQED